MAFAGFRLLVECDGDRPGDYAKRSTQSGTHGNRWFAKARFAKKFAANVQFPRKGRSKPVTPPGKACRIFGIAADRLSFKPICQWAKVPPPLPRFET